MSHRHRPSTSLLRSCAHRVPRCLFRICPLARKRRKSTTPWQRSKRKRVAIVNAIPVFIASDPDVGEALQRCRRAHAVGDDIKSLVGATILHRLLARLFEDRGHRARPRTYQLNVGGNMDFKNMLERDRLESKKISKTQAVTSQIDHGIAADSVHIGPSDHVAWPRGSQVGLHPP